jgi:dephospho-CoA kinase
MKKIGLTGGIATGKSYVLEVLRELGCEVLDADQVAHEVIEQGQPAYQEILDHFGEAVAGADGRIDRAKLGAIVFSDKSEREKLNSIVHPKVFQSQARWFEEVRRKNPSAIAVVDAALMIETGSYRRFDKLIVVYCNSDLQLERLMKRSNLNRADALARISAQMPSTEKIKYADYTIDTSEGFVDTRRQVETIFHELVRYSLNNGK